ncbi:glutathione S-transferase [Triangularia verruculosa]|uniref:Glutathione S-transferase n=1 Tax=Triangularia verruculosa TaxID=2587418 RepID=A0AAN7B093_9PEZI|nr:glutathione S-transferase [Triangularia verruculosa]
MPPLTVHHLQTSQSERLPWLLEELKIPYRLQSYPRDPLLAPPQYKSLHRQGTAPVLTDSSLPSPLTLAESGACIEYICHKHAGGKLFLKPGYTSYPDFLYWWHWSSSSFMPTVSRAFWLQQSDGDKRQRELVEKRVEEGLKMLDERLKENNWLAGSEFTVADIMVVFPLTTFRYFWPGMPVGRYPNVLRYLGRVGEREGYRKAMARCEPEMELLLKAEGPKKGFMERLPN